MANNLTPRDLSVAARNVIRRTYLIGSAPADPHTALTDLGRSVIVFGNMLQDLSDQYGKVGNKFASGVAVAGRIFWGIVELSVPASIFRYLLRNWLSLLALLSVFTIVIGFATRNNNMWGVGVVLLGGAVLIAVFSGVLRYYMLKAKIPPKIFVWIRLGLLMLAVLLFADLAVTQGDAIAKKLEWLAGFFRWCAGLLPHPKVSP